MWEAIESNKRRSWVLMILMTLLLVVLGYTIGGAIDANVNIGHRVVGGVKDYVDLVDSFAEQREPPPTIDTSNWFERIRFIHNDGAIVGALAAAALSVILILYAWFGGDSTLLSTAKAIPVEKQDAPQLYNVVEEMTIAAGLGKPPSVYLIDDDTPNAFAVGRKPETASVAVTTGLLKRLSRDELQGVVAHEIGHIHNYDIRFLTLASVLLGSIVLISEVFLRSLRYGTGRRSSSKGGGGGQIALLIIAILCAILAPIMAHILFFACSRRREYLADASAAVFTRYPEGLASALEKISVASRGVKEISKSHAALYIVNPLQSPTSSNIFSTHPPLQERITILRAMSGMAGYADYEKAYERIHGTTKPLLDKPFLSTQSPVSARQPTPLDPDALPAAATTGVVARSHEALDLLDRAASFITLPCACGVRLRVPPGLKADSLKCPRCGNRHEIPRAAPAPSSEPVTYRRRSAGWESFRCRCGHTLQISPSFGAPDMTCPKCETRVAITS